MGDMPNATPPNRHSRRRAQAIARREGRIWKDADARGSLGLRPRVRQVLYLTPNALARVEQAMAELTRAYVALAASSEQARTSLPVTPYNVLSWALSEGLPIVEQKLATGAWPLQRPDDMLRPEVDIGAIS